MTPNLLPEGCSENLYNPDLAPTPRRGRTWHAYNIFALWSNDVHALGNYAFAFGLFALGLGGWQILLTLGLGSVVLFVLLTLSGIMGERVGVPFPVISRIAFGVRGCNIPAVLRGGVAIVWFGIQTYLAATVLVVLVLTVAPSSAALTDIYFLGLSALGWICFVGLWLLQVTIVSFGMEMIRRYQALASPLVLVTMLSLAIWLFIKAEGSISWSTEDSLEGPAMWALILKSAALWVVIYGTFLLNFCDFSRNATSQRAIIKGNIFGIPFNMLFFAAIVVVLAGSQYTIDGTIIDSPAEVVQAIPNHFVLAAASIMLIVLTVAVNLMGNLVAPIYTLTNLMPRLLNFRRAAIISAVLGILILPWNLYDSPLVIVYFLGGLGAFLGPLFGVIVSDYWLLRKGRINIPDLYTDDPHGEYHYRRGINWRAISAAAPAAAVSLVIALVPAFSDVAGFSWFIGALLAAGLYYLVADRSGIHRAVDGEHLSVKPSGSV